MYEHDFVPQLLNYRTLNFNTIQVSIFYIDLQQLNFGNHTRLHSKYMREIRDFSDENVATVALWIAVSI